MQIRKVIFYVENKGQWNLAVVKPSFLPLAKSFIGFAKDKNLAKT